MTAAVNPVGSLTLRLSAADYSILAVYFAFVIGIGWMLRRRLRTSCEFLESGRSLPAWICALAFVGANLGAQEVIGMAASGAKYGLATAHFYWGAIPAMVFIGIFMMPFYYGSKARSVPEYLNLRYDGKTRALNALTFVFMTVFSSGISMHIFALLLESLLGVSYSMCVLAASGIVLVYIYSGGLTSAIYNEVIQFFLIIAGFLPLVVAGLKDVGGWAGLVAKLNAYSATRGMPGAWTTTWANLNSARANPMGVDWFGMIFGLGFVLAFGYWCTDFLVVQRAMAARNMNAARLTPILATLPKMVFPALVIVPGMIAIAVYHSYGAAALNLPASPDGSLNYNMVVPALLARYLPNGLLGVGITALMASFMSGMAGNVTAFNTVVTYDLYQGYWDQGAGDRRLLAVGRASTVLGLLLSAGAAYTAREFNNIMDLLQLIFGFVNAPLFAIFLLGMFWRRATGHGAFFGLLMGTATAVIFHGVTLPAGNAAGIKGGWIVARWEFQSSLAQGFWMAIFAFSVCLAATFLISIATRPNRTHEELAGLVYSLTPRTRPPGVPWHQRPEVLAVVALAAMVALYLAFW